METVGTHFILDLYDCPRRLLNDRTFVENALTEAVDLGLATLLTRVSHKFQPHGVTVVGLLAESHISIHTWPERGYAGADIFTCGETADPERACLHLARAFEADRYDLARLERGTGETPTYGNRRTTAAAAK